MRRVVRFVADHPLLTFRVSAAAVSLLLLAMVDQGRTLTAAEVEEIVIGEPALLCFGSGEPITEYFVAGGAYHFDGPGSDDAYGRWRLDPGGQICIEVEGEPPDCRFVWRYGDRFSWMWANPHRFADFALLPEDPCEWGR